MTLTKLLKGAAAGTVATVPMSALMLGAGKVGLMGRQPPEAITREVVEEVAGSEPQGATSDALASVAHLGFGAVGGALYAAVPRPERVPPVALGVPFALGIWAASYRGWVPALGALPHADRDRKDRVASMVAAHVVFGAVLALLEDRWSD